MKSAELLGIDTVRPYGFHFGIFKSQGITKMALPVILQAFLNGDGGNLEAGVGCGKISGIAKDPVNLKCLCLISR
jgi:hypothetical protein